MMVEIRPWPLRGREWQHQAGVPSLRPQSKPARKPGQTSDEAAARIRAAEAKRRRRALSPAARRYVGLLDRYLSLPEGDESLDDVLNAAHDGLTPADVAAIAAWQEVTL